ncbi:hypothetical protein [Bacillus pumilus]|uniref:hypothetical protein n=1 Tax=Bacillus pumilus TaxID=1408 RepID=UPI001249F8AE|nr:hypothetical protein [Bacillus pumilus]
MPNHLKKQFARDLYDHALDANTRKLLQVYLQQQTEDEQIYNDLVSKLEAIFNLMFKKFKPDDIEKDTYKTDFMLKDINNGVFRFIDKENIRPENVAFSFQESSDQPIVGYFNDQQVFIPTKSIKEALFKSSTPMSKALTRIKKTINILSKGLKIFLLLYYLLFLIVVGSLNFYNEQKNEIFNQEIEMISTSPIDAFSGLFQFLNAAMEALFK